MPTKPVDVRFTDLVYTIPARNTHATRLLPCVPTKTTPSKTILHAISGYVPAGQSLAILGPSGSGKTTLLNLLAARSEHPPASGKILFGNRPRVPRTKRHIGYVMQDDVFFSKLTVRETLDFTARLRIPRLSPENRARRVDELIKSLRLTNCSHTRIGDQQFDKGISGGERKRVNIANELLHDPSVLLADECTSGLDSSSAVTVINLLRRLCSEGRTVIATIHQPSSQMFDLFDSIMLLAAGRVAYFGPPHAVTSYFHSVGFPFPTTAFNPADYMLELVIDDETKASEQEQPQQKPHDPEQQFSTQRALLDAWQAHGPELIESAGESQRPRKRSRHPVTQSPDVVLQVSEHDASASTTLTPSSDASADDVHLPQDPLPPTSYPARLVRAATKRYYDVTGQHGKHDEPDKYPTGWLQQVYVLGQRAVRQKSGVLLQPVYIIQVICVTLISALFWWQIELREGTIEDRLGALSFFAIFWSFYSMFSAIFSFPSEKRVINKDRAGGSYRLSAYYFAKTMVETPADTLYPIFFAAIVYFAIGLNPDFRSFLLFTVLLVMNVLTAQSIGLLISSSVMDVRDAQVVSSVWVLSSMLISGYYIDPDNTPSFLEWLRVLSFIRYTYEAMVRAEMSFGREFRCATGDEDSTVYSIALDRPGCTIGKESVLRGSQLDGSLSILGNIGVLLTWIVVTRMLGYFALKLLHTSHKPKSSTWREA